MMIADSGIKSFKGKESAYVISLACLMLTLAAVSGLLIVSEDADAYVSEWDHHSTWGSNDCIIELTGHIKSIDGINHWSNTTLTVSGTGPMADYPATQYSYYTTAPWIDAAGYNSTCNTVEKVVIMEGVTHVGALSFQGLHNLNEVVLPHSLISIGDGAFEKCGNLKEVITRDNLEWIGSGAFSECKRLSHVYLGESVNTIGSGAFIWCPLKEINLPNSVKTISGAFRFSGIESVQLPADLKSIGKDAFSYCSNLKSIKIPETVEYIGDGAFEHCTSLTAVVIPDSVKEIGYGAFESCGLLSTVELPDSIEVIKWDMFSNSGLQSIRIPDSVKIIESSAFSNCKQLTDVMMGGSVEEIGFFAFQGCDKLDGIIFPESLKRMGEATSGFQLLKNFYLPAGLEIIDPIYRLFKWYDLDGNLVEPTVENLRGHLWESDGKLFGTAHMVTAGESDSDSTPSDQIPEKLSPLQDYLRRSVSRLIDWATSEIPGLLDIGVTIYLMIKTSWSPHFES